MEAKLDDIVHIIEVARETGKIKKGINEITKAAERGTAQLVVWATDVSPAEITLHLKPLCEEKGVAFANVGTKQDLGTAAGLRVGTAGIAVVDAGEAKKALAELSGKE